MSNNSSGKRVSPHFLTVIILWITYIVVTAIPSYGVPVISTHLMIEKGWSESLLSIIAVVTTVSYAVAGVPASLLIRKFGEKKTVLAFCLCTIAAFFILTFFSLPAYLYVFMFVLFGFGTSSVLIATPAIINKWFDRNKALPTSIILAAGAVGGFVFPQVSELLLKSSFRTAWIVYLSMEICVWLLFLFAAKETPKEAGEIVDSRAWVEKHPDAENENASLKNTAGFITLGACYKTSAFFKLLIQIVSVRAIYASMTSYLVFYALQRGLTSGQAAACLSAMSLVGLFGRLSVGSVDKLHIPYYVLNVISFAGMAAGFVMLALGTTYLPLVAGSGIIGFFFGINYNLFVLIIPKVFGDDNFSVLYGTYNSAASVGGALGPILLFSIASALNSYGNAYLAMGALCALGLLAAILLPIRAVRAASPRQTASEPRPSS